MIVSSLLFTLFCFVFIIGVILVMLGLPGTWLIVADACLFAWVRNFQAGIDLKVILIVTALALLGEVIEWVASTLGPKKQNVPTGAIISSMVGGIFGAVIGVPVMIIGSVLGLFVGTYLGAFLYGIATQSSVGDSFRNSRIILTSRFISIFAKTAVALVMAIYLVFKW